MQDKSEHKGRDGASTAVPKDTAAGEDWWPPKERTAGKQKKREKILREAQTSLFK